MSRATDCFRVRRLAEGLQDGSDNFLLLRLLAASLVIYGHGPAFTRTQGRPDILAWMGDGYSGELAVDVFFLASGFMVSGSFLRRGLLEFVWARVIRIYPAYLVCLACCAYLLGALYTELPLAAYFGDHGVARYVTQNLQLSHNLIWALPGVFKHNPLDAVNGSIWTLPAEVRMYLWLALLGALGILACRRWSSAVLMLLFAWGLLQPAHIPLLPVDAYRRLGAYFILGVFCYINRELVPVGWFVVVALALFAWLVHATAIYPFAFGLALAAFVFAFAYATPWHGFNRFGDYSYGLYLWGFPVQQAIAYHLPRIGPLQNALLAWPIALLLAMASWHWVEKPCLNLKQLPRALLTRARLQWGNRLPLPVDERDGD